MTKVGSQIEYRAVAFGSTAGEQGSGGVTICEVVVMSQFIARQKTRLYSLNRRAKTLGLSVCDSLGNELHCGWWFIVNGAPRRWNVYAICKSLDEVDSFLAHKRVHKKIILNSLSRAAGAKIGLVEALIDRGIALVCPAESPREAGDGLNCLKVSI